PADRHVGRVVDVVGVKQAAGGAAGDEKNECNAAELGHGRDRNTLRVDAASGGPRATLIPRTDAVDRCLACRAAGRYTTCVVDARRLVLAGAHPAGGSVPLRGPATAPGAAGPGAGRRLGCAGRL